MTSKNRLALRVQRDTGHRTLSLMTHKCSLYWEASFTIGYIFVYQGGHEFFLLMTSAQLPSFLEQICLNNNVASKKELGPARRELTVFSISQIL